MRRTLGWMAIVGVLVPSVPARAQIPVTDALNLVQAIAIAEKVATTLGVLIQQYERIQRVATGLPGLEQYRLPGIPTVMHDVGRFPYGAPWLQGLNSGDARGAGYVATVRPLQRDLSVLTPLPTDTQEAIKAAYATIEILDSVSMMGGHQAAIVRTYHSRIQDLIDLLENTVLSQVPGVHELTAVADKVALGQLLARRQSVADAQILSASLEASLARNKRTRDAAADDMNYRLNHLRYAPIVGPKMVDGDEDVLANWRLP